MPNFVCELCWIITEAFHELYQKSKTVQENFLSLSLIETDSVTCNKMEQIFDEDSQGVGLIKLEPSYGEFWEYKFVSLKRDVSISIWIKNLFLGYNRRGFTWYSINWRWFVWDKRRKNP